MNRDILRNLIAWKNSADRKPLILRGARQVGKTWVMKLFGEQEYQNVAYFNMNNDSILSNIFEANFDTNRIINELKIYSGVKIKKIIP